MVGQFLILVLLSLLSASHTALVRCNRTVSKLQLCNSHQDVYDKGISIPIALSGNPATIQPYMIVYKVADFNDQENTITLNFMLSITWYDIRIGRLNF